MFIRFLSEIHWFQDWLTHNYFKSILKRYSNVSFLGRDSNICSGASSCIYMLRNIFFFNQNGPKFHLYATNQCSSLFILISFHFVNIATLLTCFFGLSILTYEYFAAKYVHLYRIRFTMKLLLWCFVFLNVLPFNFLIPSLTDRKSDWMHILYLIWYGCCIWNSPLLQYIKHYKCHAKMNNINCLGGNSVSRCILMMGNNEFRHIRKLQRALAEIQSAENVQKSGSSSSMKAYQTVKCMILLKRKIKRIREKKNNLL